MNIRNRAPHARRRPSLAHLIEAQLNYLATLRGDYRREPVHLSAVQRELRRRHLADRYARICGAAEFLRALALGLLAALGLAAVAGLIGGAL